MSVESHIPGARVRVLLAAAVAGGVAASGVALVASGGAATTPSPLASSSAAARRLPPVPGALGGLLPGAGQPSPAPVPPAAVTTGTTPGNGVVVNVGAAAGSVPSVTGTNVSPGSTFDLAVSGGPSGPQLWPTVSSLLTSPSSAVGAGVERMSGVVNQRYCPSSGDCTYHWRAHTPGASDNPIGATTTRDPSAQSPDEWMTQAATVAAGRPFQPVMVVNVERGSIAEADDLVAYMNGDTASVQLLPDGTTVGDWAALRARNRGGNPAPYGVVDWEIGNEEWSLASPGSMTNSDGCQPVAGLGSNGSVYGCIVYRYAAAMRAVRTGTRIAIVANLPSVASFNRAALLAAARSIDLVDFHLYAPAADPLGTTFTLDGQSQSYAVSPVVSGGTQLIQYVLWMTASAAVTTRVWLDGQPQAVRSVSSNVASFYPTVPAFSYGATPQPFTFTAATSPGVHTLGLSTCNQRDVAGACQASGAPLSLDLHHISWLPVQGLPETPDDLYAQASRAYCFAGDPGTVVDTGVIQSQPATATQPSRLSPADFALAFGGGAGAYIGGALGHARETMGAVSLPIIIGEFGPMGGCDEQPTNLVTTMAGAMSTANIALALAADTDTARPVVGAATFELSSAMGARPEGPICQGWALVRTDLSPTSVSCTGTDTGYLTAVGWALGRFGSLSGSRCPVTAGGVPVLASAPLAEQPPAAVTAVQGIASLHPDGHTITLVLANQSPIDSFTLPVTVQGGQLSGVTDAYTVAGVADPSAAGSANTDLTPNAIGAVPAAVSTVSGVSVSLPPFSVTSMTLTIL